MFGKVKKGSLSEEQRRKLISSSMNVGSIPNNSPNYNLPVKQLAELTNPKPQAMTVNLMQLRSFDANRLTGGGR